MPAKRQKTSQPRKSNIESKTFELNAAEARPRPDNFGAADLVPRLPTSPAYDSRKLTGPVKRLKGHSFQAESSSGVMARHQGRPSAQNIRSHCKQRSECGKSLLPTVQAERVSRKSSTEAETLLPPSLACEAMESAKPDPQASMIADDGQNSPSLSPGTHDLSSPCLPPRRPEPTFQLISADDRPTTESVPSPSIMVQPAHRAPAELVAKPKVRPSQSAKLPAKKLAELLEGIFEAEDEIPGPDDLQEQSWTWENDSFEAVQGGRAVLKGAMLVTLFQLLQGASTSFDDFALRELMNKKDLERLHPPPRQLYDLNKDHLARLVRILEQAASCCEGVNPLQPTLSSKRKSAGFGMEPDADLVAAQQIFVERVELLNRSVLAGQCIFALMSACGPPKALVSEDAIHTALMALKSCADGALVPFGDAISETSTEGNSGATRFFGAIARALPAAKKALRKESKCLTSLEAEAVRAWECILALGHSFEYCKSALSSLLRLFTSGNCALSEPIIITVFYLALKLLFMPETDGRTDGRAEGRGAPSSSVGRLAALWQSLDKAVGLSQTSLLARLRQPCLSLVQFLFAKHPEQRAWIFEEIMSNLINLPDTRGRRNQYRLSNGASAHPINALLVQIIQSADEYTGAFHSTAPGQVSLQEQSPPDPLSIDIDEGELPSDLDHCDAHYVRRDAGAVGSDGYHLDGAIAASGMVTSFLVNKCVIFAFVVAPKTNASNTPGSSTSPKSIEALTSLDSWA